MNVFKTLISLYPNDVHLQNECGDTLFHIAAQKMNLEAVHFLLNTCLDKNSQNQKGFTPLQLLEKASRNCKDLKFSSPTKIDMFVECATTLMQNEQKASLINGWFSPRMMKMLALTAEIGYDVIRDNDDVDEVFDITFAEYIPQKVSRNNPELNLKSFRAGWIIVWGAMKYLLRTQKVPTKSKVLEQVYIFCLELPEFDLGNWQYFVDKGGKIDYALDALVKSTSEIYIHGDGLWKYETFEDDIEQLISTPLDAAFDVAKIKCLELTSDNGRNHPNGPYHYNFSKTGDDDDGDY